MARRVFVGARSSMLAHASPRARRGAPARRRSPSANSAHMPHQGRRSRPWGGTSSFGAEGVERQRRRSRDRSSRAPPVGRRSRHARAQRCGGGPSSSRPAAVPVEDDRDVRGGVGWNDCPCVTAPSVVRSSGACGTMGAVWSFCGESSPRSRARRWRESLLTFNGEACFCENRRESKRSVALCQAAGRVMHEDRRSGGRGRCTRSAPCRRAPRRRRGRSRARGPCRRDRRGWSRSGGRHASAHVTN
jgi:hypothetical protein